MDFCPVQKEWDKIQEQITSRIHKEFMAQYGGNKTRFAKKAGCDEKALRKLFEEQMGMSINLLFKLAKALGKDPSEFLEGLRLEDLEESESPQISPE